jgi:membrane carboxypeptidase/penicillin-binding protein
MYLNLIYFGNGSYGVESTSKMYFGKSVKELNIVECAMIVATISNPGYYSPLMNINNSISKTKRILYSLNDAGYLNEDKIEPLYQDFIRKWEIAFDDNKKVTGSKIGSFIYSSYRINLSPLFNERIRRELVERFGEDAVKKGGLSVYTTIDAFKQEAATKTLRNGIQQQRDYHLKISSRLKSSSASHKEKLKAEDIEGALISLNPFTGEILSYAGGFDFTTTNQNDNVYQSRRQPGSSIKPLVYAAAIRIRNNYTFNSFH